jgi:hypothetical protein
LRWNACPHEDGRPADNLRVGVYDLLRVHLAKDTSAKLFGGGSDES